MQVYKPASIRLIAHFERCLTGVPHFIAPIATDVAAAEGVAAQLVQIMESRARQFAPFNARNIEEFNHAIMQTSQHAKMLPRIAVIVDEFTDLVLTAGAKSPLFADITRLVSKGAAFGITCILATQHPKSEVLNTLIRANLTTRIGFRCNEADQSRVIVGDARATKLPQVPGRTAIRVGDKYITTQTFWISPSDADAVALSLTPQSVSDGVVFPVSAELTRLVTYALGHLSGAFTVGKLAAAFDIEAPADSEGKITRWRIQKLAHELQQAGLLTEPANAIDPRRVTPELAALCSPKAPGSPIQATDTQKSA